MLAPYFLSTWSAILLLSFLTAPTGLFLVWNQCTTLSEGLGHASLLGLALHLGTGLPLMLSLFTVNILICLFQIFWKNTPSTAYSYEGHLQVVSIGAFSAGLFLVHTLQCGENALKQALWGDLLGITFYDLIPLVAAVFATLLIFFLNFKKFLAILVDPELAQLEGLNVERLQALLWITLATAVTIGLCYFGTLLLSPILITPALLVRPYTASPERSLLAALGVSILLLSLGLAFSTATDFGLSASICIISALALFLPRVITSLLRYLSQSSLNFLKKSLPISERK